MVSSIYMTLSDLLILYINGVGRFALPGFPSIIGAVSGDTLYFGTILTCQLIVDRPVNYSWTDLTYGNTTIGSQLTVWQSGSYQCMASINSDGSWSTTEKTVYNLTIENLPSTAKSIVYETDLASTAKSIVYETDLASTAKSIAYETDLASTAKSIAYETDLPSTAKSIAYETDLSSTARPSYGPIAGGTNVTLTLENWSTQIANISAAYLGGILKSTELQQSDRLSNSVVMTTPVAAETLIGKPLPITIEFTPGPYNITTNLSFTYRGNPNITGISPSTFIVTGGTTVNVTGMRLTSVANPFIQVTIVVQRGIEINSTSERSFQPCEVKDGSRMTCRMPNVSIPNDFLQLLDSLYNNYNRSKRDTNLMSHQKAENPLLLSRRKRYANALSLNGTNGVDQLFIYLGFILDGYQKYDNINNVLPNTQILIFSPPEISFTKDIIEYDADKDEFISIKGKHMTRGCRLVDYVVKVGADICENIGLTDNQLRCRPPKQQPPSTRNGSVHCDQLLSIDIHLGFKTDYQYACMKYSTPPPVLIIGLAVGFSSFVVIILLIIAIVFCCKKSRNSRPANNTLDRNTSAVNEAYEPPSDQLHANDAHLQPSSKSDAYETYMHPSDQLNAKEKYEPPSDQLYAVGLYLRPAIRSLYANDEY